MLTCSYVHTITCSHVHILTCSHVHILTCSHVHILTCSHVHILTCSHVHMLAHAHMPHHILTCSHTHMLTCPRAGALVVGGTYFREGNSTVFAQSLGCLGNESGLANCLKTATVGNNCTHSQDAGVICQGEVGWMEANYRQIHTHAYIHGHTYCTLAHTHTHILTQTRNIHTLTYKHAHTCTHTYTHTHTHLHTALPCKAGALRLADGTDQYSGCLEVCNGGQWGTVCGKDVSNDLAWTACGLLGFDSKGRRRGSKPYPSLSQRGS